MIVSDLGQASTRVANKEAWRLIERIGALWRCSRGVFDDAQRPITTFSIEKLVSFDEARAWTEGDDAFDEHKKQNERRRRRRVHG